MEEFLLGLFLGIVVGTFVTSLFAEEERADSDSLDLMNELLFGENRELEKEVKQLEEERKVIEGVSDGSR